LLNRGLNRQTGTAVTCPRRSPPAHVGHFSPTKRGQDARAVQAAYDDLAPVRLIEAAKRYGAAYIIVRDRALPGDPAFQTGPYRVYGLGR